MGETIIRVGRLARGLDHALRAGRPTVETLEEALRVVAAELAADAVAFWQPTDGGEAVRLVAEVVVSGEGLPDAGRGTDEVVRAALAAHATVRAGRSLLVPAAVGGEVLGALAVVGSASGALLPQEHCELAAGLVAGLVCLTAAEERFAAVTGSSIDALVIADAEGRIESFNARAEEIFGWSCEEVVGRPLTLLMPERFRAAHERALGSVSAGAPPRRLGQVLDLTAQRRSGEEFPVELTLGTWTVGAERCYTGSFRDVSERVRAVERIERLVYTHSRTGLPNEADLRRRLATTAAGGALVAVGVGRLDVVVEEIGSAAAEATMREAARLLAAVVPEGGSVHHREGDVLLALLPGPPGGELTRIGERCVAALSGAPVVAGQELALEPAVGVALVGAHEPARAVDHALRALSAAREEGPGAVRCFGEVAERRRATLAVEAELRRGISRGELVLHYQPIVALRTGRIRALEALVRWQHPERGLLAPGAFIDLAERTSLIDELGGWVVEESCRQLAAWRGEGRDLRVSFNVSPRQLRRGGVIQRLEEAIRVTGAPPDRLIAEVTETTAVEDLDEGRDVLSSLADLGLGVALDDFGTGRSSLGRLAELPVDSLKLDRSLVSGLPDDRAGRALVRAGLQLARGLGLRVVAEGVERPEQLRWLRDAGCELAQGYLLSRPVPAGEVPAAVAAAEAVCVPSAPVVRPAWTPHGERWSPARARIRRRHC